MKLESIKTFVVANPPPGFGGKYFVFVKIRTACGIEGVGEAYAATFSPHIIAAMTGDAVLHRRRSRTPSVPLTPLDNRAHHTSADQRAYGTTASGHPPQIASGQT